MIKKYFFAVFTAMVLAVSVGGGIVNAQTYTSIEAVEAAINAGTATKYVDILQFGTANGQTLEWIYVGPGGWSNFRPYFIMTKDSFQTKLNMEKRYDPSLNHDWIGSELYGWLNGDFKQNYLGNNQKIYEVTLPTMYDNYIRIYEFEYSCYWWYRDYSDSDKAYVQSNDEGPFRSYVDGYYNVRPAFFLKTDGLNQPIIKINGGTDFSDVTVLGSIAVDISCSHNIDYLTAPNNAILRPCYQWSTDSNKPLADWISFQPNTTVTTTQSVAATWYLHVSSTDILGRETYVKKKYIITAASATTGITLQDKQDIAGLVNGSSNVVNGATSAATAADQATTAATQATTAANNTTYNGKSAAEWAAIAAQTYTPPPVFTVRPSDGVTFIANGGDNIQAVTSDGTQVTGIGGVAGATKQEWSWTGKKIYALICNANGIIVLAGEDGNFQTRTSAGELLNANKGTWTHTGKSINAISGLPNGKFILIGQEGSYQQVTVNDTGAFTLGTSGTLTGLGQVASATPRTDGRILVADTKGRQAYYKLDNTYDISAQTVNTDSATLNTTWEGAGFQNAKLLITPESETTTEQDISGNTATVEDLTSGKNYTFQVKSLLNYPVYFTSKPITVATPMPVAITDFTDRVTGANSWMKTQEEIQKYNLYFPDSEVVSKFVINPNEMNIHKYNITFDANADNTAGIDMKYIKIVKIDYDGVTKWGYKDDPAPPDGADKPLCGNTNSKTISFHIDNPHKKVVTVWCKYKFKNTDLNNIPSSFRNKVEVTAESGGNTKVLEPQYNDIRLRKAKMIYM